MADFFSKRVKKNNDDVDMVDLTKRNKNVPWVEKYRPKKVDELCFQEEIVAVMKSVLNGGDLPHMLLFGPPGTGKTSAAVALAREMFGKAYKDRVLEMNASDERGIQVVRNRIKGFARRALPPHKRVINGVEEHVVNLKIVILDEADAMTSAAQSAMRRVMEKHSKTTRFFLICNYVSRIITPLISRCAKFRFKPLPFESQIERLRYICAEEGVEYEEVALAKLIELCEGDLRKSITNLQAVSRGYRHISLQLVEGMTAKIPDAEVDYLLSACREPHFEGLMVAIEHVRRQAYSSTQMIQQLMELILMDDMLHDVHKAEILEKMAIAEGRITDRADGCLNLQDVCATIQKQYAEIIHGVY